jgi:tRNA/tmRNA/rRNA uracil-C5-methylase (TrmA/RlmC/RlmD family)
VRGRSLVGERYVVEVDRVAHGGHCVARHEGVVVFVRHTLPGERVVVRITEGDEGSQFLRGDAVEVLRESPDRVVRPCPFSGPGRCGGCDFQHVALPAQRDLKAIVVREQLQRLAGLDVDVVVEPVAGDVDGLGWRTRVQFAIDQDGHAGLRRHRSHEIERIDFCPIADPGLPPVTSDDWSGTAGVDPAVRVGPAVKVDRAEAVEAIVSGTGETLRIVSAGKQRFFDGPEVLHEKAAGRTWQVTGSGFWQVHPGAAEALVSAVLAGAEPRAGERAADLYCGVGLFAGALAEAVEPAGSVLAVEADRVAALDAAANLGDLPQVEVLADRVDHALRRGALGEHVDIVVLDPPRTGARREVVEGIVGLTPRVVAYVACDPAALARDVAIFGESGYRLTGLRGFDLFPMTSHVECVATFERAGSDLR